MLTEQSLRLVLECTVRRVIDKLVQEEVNFAVEQIKRNVHHRMKPMVPELVKVVNEAITIEISKNNAEAHISYAQTDLDKRLKEME